MATTSVINPNVNLEKILGQQFKELITLLESPDPWKYFKNKEIDPGKKSRPPGSSDEDIHPSLFQRLMASVVAFREIEHPKLEKIESSVKIAEVIGNIMDKLINDANNVHPYQVDNYLFKYSKDYSMAISHLVPGFNLFPSNSAAYQPDFIADKAGTPLINTIKFLYFYIALLDSFSFRTGRDVVVFLMENDNIYFNSYVNKLVEHIMAFLGNQEDIDKTTVRYGVYEALKDVADVISSDLSKSSSGPIELDTRNIMERINNLDNYYKMTGGNKETVDFDSLIRGIFGLDANAKIVENLPGNLKSIVNVLSTDDNYKDILQMYYGNQTEQKNTMMNSLYNEEYLNVNIVNEELTRTKDVVHPLASGKNVGKVDSAQFLYATYAVEGRRPKLVTLNQYGADGEGVEDSKLINYEYVKVIREITHSLSTEEFGKSNNNLSRAAFLGLIFYFVENNLDINAVDHYTHHMVDIKKYMINFVNKYKELYSRLYLVKEKLGIQNGETTKIGTDETIINTFVNGFALSIGEIYKVLSDGSLMLKAPPPPTLSTAPPTTTFKTLPKEYEQEVERMQKLMKQREHVRLLVRLQTQEECIARIKEQSEFLAVQLARRLHYARRAELANVVAKKIGVKAIDTIIEHVEYASDLHNDVVRYPYFPDPSPYDQDGKLMLSPMKDIEYIAGLLSVNTYLMPLDQLETQLKQLLDFVRQASDIQEELIKQINAQNLTELLKKIPNVSEKLNELKKEIESVTTLEVLEPLKTLQRYLDRNIDLELLNKEVSSIRDEVAKLIVPRDIIHGPERFDNLKIILENAREQVEKQIDKIINLPILQNANLASILEKGEKLLNLTLKASSVLYQQHAQQVIVLKWQLYEMMQKKPELTQLEHLVDRIYSIQEANLNSLGQEISELGVQIPKYIRELTQYAKLIGDTVDRYLEKDLLEGKLSSLNKDPGIPVKDSTGNNQVVIKLHPKVGPGVHEKDLVGGVTEIIETVDVLLKNVNEQAKRAAAGKAVPNQKYIDAHMNEFRKQTIKSITNKNVVNALFLAQGKNVVPANVADVFKGLIYGTEMLADKLTNFKNVLTKIINSTKDHLTYLKTHKFKKQLDRLYFEQLNQSVQKIKIIQQAQKELLSYLEDLATSEVGQHQKDFLENLQKSFGSEINNLVQSANDIENRNTISLDFVPKYLEQNTINMRFLLEKTVLEQITRGLYPIYYKVIEEEKRDKLLKNVAPEYYKTIKFVDAEVAISRIHDSLSDSPEDHRKKISGFVDALINLRDQVKDIGNVANVFYIPREQVPLAYKAYLDHDIYKTFTNMNDLARQLDQLRNYINRTKELWNTQFAYARQLLDRLKSLPRKQWKQLKIVQWEEPELQEKGAPPFPSYGYSDILGGIDRGKISSFPKSSLKRHKFHLDHLGGNSQRNLGNKLETSTAKMMSMYLTHDIFGGALATETYKPSLADPKIYDFYKNVVTKNVGFYSKFFILLRKDESDNEVEIPDLRHALNVTEQERSKYRLNVIKKIGWKSLQNIQRGGVYGIIGDIALIQYIPVYNPNLNIGNVWIDNARNISRSYLSSNPEALANIARTTYYRTDYTVTVPTDPTPIKVNIIPMAKFISTYGAQYDMSAILKKLLASPLDEPKLTSSWLEHEIRLQEHLLRSRSEWIREGDTFVRLDKQGNRLEEIPEDNCAFIKNSVQECIQFLNSCALVPDGSKNIPDDCKNFVDFEFEINPPIQTLIDKIIKINPKVAFGILKKFGFGSYLSEVKYGPTQKLRLFKVQSVGSWLREMEKGCSSSEKCSHRFIPLRKYLGDEFADLILKMARDPSKRAFFDYFDILVEWVNANPQVLNKEITKIQYPGPEVRYPHTNERFNIYQYFNPYKPAELRLRGIVCGLDRLRTSILNGMSGINGTSLISNIAMTPPNIELPLSRTTVVTPLTFSSPVLMTGGSIFNVQEEFKNIKTLYGYKFFGQIYSDLENMMRGLTRSMRLSSETKKNIDEKLSKIKVLEEELWDNINSLIRWYEVFRASQGNVDISSVSESDLPAILEKHSNLLQLSTAYNKRAINLIELFKTIAEAVLRKAEEKKSGNQIMRPMTMNYP